MDPALDFADAMARFAALQAQEGPEVNPVCKSFVLSHEEKTPRALVFFHGYTNCPQQFRQLGEEFHRRGYNVFAPRQPYQGLLDRLSEDHAKLTAEDLIKSTNAAVDIACGLGDEVIVSGLSCGGIMAAWAAQYRQDVALAVLASPVFGVGVLPPFMNGFGRGVMQSLPNRFVWWDPRVKAKIAGCPHGYPRWATHALAQMMRMGASVRRDAAKTGPRAQTRAADHQRQRSGRQQQNDLPAGGGLETAGAGEGADL